MIAKAIKDHKKAIIPYVTAGLPNLYTTGKILLALQDAGAAVIEIGIPFSDPMADGPVLQKAAFMALQAGFKMDELQGCLKGWSTTCCHVLYQPPDAQGSSSDACKP
jgi:tryptophan synthase alpha chain